jgi:hypothetical protein
MRGESRGSIQGRKQSYLQFLLGLASIVIIIAAGVINMTGTAAQLGPSGGQVVQLLVTVDTLRVPTQQQHRVAYVYY